MTHREKHADKKMMQKHSNDAKIIGRIFQAFKPYTAQIIVVLISILITTLLSLISPLVIRTIFDGAIPHHDLRLLLFCVAVLVVMPLVIGFITVGQNYQSALIGQRVIRDFRNKLFVHLQSMSFRFFTSTRTGEIQSRLSNDVSGVQAVVTDTGTRVIANVSLLLSIIMAMIYISPLLTIFTLGVFPIFVWITYKVGEMGRVTQKDTQLSKASLTALMEEALSISGLLMIKIFGRQQLIMDQFADENQQLTTLGVRLQVINSWFLMMVNIVFTITPAIVYLVAGWQIIGNPLGQGITLGSVVAFTTLQARLGPTIGQLLNVQVQAHGALALFERIFEYLDMPIDIQSSSHALKLTSDQIQGAVAFQDVTFNYTKKAEPTDKAEDSLEEKNTAVSLEQISFAIKPGQLIALVGPSGAGKTTIAYLLSRLYDVDRGAVLIDSHNIKDIDLACLSELMSMVTQETFLFHTSIRENLLYGRPDATDEELIAAAKAAAIHDCILSFEHGYDTVVGERGYRLSGGEKQRIAIARVILKNPRILILDEATSALDTHSERLVQGALETLMKQRTTLAIAHRLSTVLAADLILVIDKGRIVERGSHHELLALDGLYSSLYREQFLQPLPANETENSHDDNRSLMAYT